MAQALQPATMPDGDFEQDFSRALQGDKTQTQLRDALRKLAEKEPDAFVRGIRTLMTN